MTKRIQKKFGGKLFLDPGTYELVHDTNEVEGFKM